MDYVALGIGLLLGGIIGFILAHRNNTENTQSSNTDQGNQVLGLQQQLNQLDKAHGIVEAENQRLHQEYQAVKQDLAEEQNQARTLYTENSTWQIRYQALEEKLVFQKNEFEQLEKRFKLEFEKLADRIFEQKSQKFTTQNQHNLDAILAPFKTQIKAFEEKVDQTYKDESKERISLQAEIKQLVSMNKQLSDDANNLASALKGESKTQGDWGELRLEMILQKAGLTKGIHYSTQGGFRDEEGALKKPDFIIHLPEDKHLIIDSKVSLTAYEQYFNANSEADRAVFLKQHIQSLKKHIQDLSGKSYQKLEQINTPDYVMAFIPIEPAFTLAYQHDESLVEEALAKNIVIVTTSTLLATMRTVSFIWKQENQKKNVLEIAKKSGELYDKFVGFVDDLIDVGKRMDSAKKSYEGAMNKLSQGKGNLIRRADAMKQLGLATNKSLPQTLTDRAHQTDGPLTNEISGETDPAWSLYTPS